jgi:amidase
MDELAWLDATALAELVSKGDVTPRELVDAAIARIEALNPELNAVITPMFEHAREQADGELPDGPFRGVPFLLKDLTASYAGVTMHAGSSFVKGFVPKSDSELTSRLKRSGVVVVGKTNTPEFGILPTTEPHAFGATRNPWNREHSTGGSSGGSAAAVAAGMVPMAHANDGGGSIRIPASCCGLFGLKPTRARNPLGPVHGDILSGLVCEHAVTRSVRDSARLLDATHGPDVGDPYHAPAPKRPFAEEVGAPVGKLRVALTTQSYGGTPIHPDCVAAAESAAALLSELGHEVEEAKLPVNESLNQPFVVVWAAGVASSVAGWAHALGRQPKPEELEPLTWALAEMGRQPGAHEYLLALQYLQLASRRIARFMERYDVWLAPTLGEPPPPLGTFEASEDNPLAGFMRAFSFVPFTPICNVTGQPAASLPLYWNDDGLPIGVHIAGRFGDEATLLRLAAQLEEARPWRDKRPPQP